ncbi:MAG: IS1595 family transposase [Planctomycetota bacterium]
MSTAHPKTLMEAVNYFADPDVCHEYMKAIKWPDGEVCCPKCGSVNVGEIKSRRMFQCREKGCRKQFSVKVGTIFEDSSLPLSKWFVAVWVIANSKNGVSSCELARTIGVTQKSAWHMLHRIRLAMQTKSFRKIEGEVEGDETYIGGRYSNMHKAKKAKMPKGRGTVGKTVVQGLIERGGEVRAKVVPDTKAKTLQAIVRENVQPGAEVFTDTAAGYHGLQADYIHEMIDHAIKYVDGKVHTNTMENFWALLKRSLGGTYVSVAPEHLDAYLDEQVERFNARKLDDGGRFVRVMGRVLGRRLTWADLTR